MHTAATPSLETARLWVGDCHAWALFQAGHNFYNVDLSYVKRLCGTMLGGPKLPQK